MERKQNDGKKKGTIIRLFSTDTDGLAFPTFILFYFYPLFFTHFGRRSIMVEMSFHEDEEKLNKINVELM
jgi:hypothetical protein